MEFANYFIMRALQHGWDLLKQKDATFWDDLFPAGVSADERANVRTTILAQDVLIRPSYHLNVVRDTPHVLSVTLLHTETAPENPFNIGPDATTESWAFDDGAFAVWVISYHELTMMTLSNIVRCIMDSFILDGWFIRQGFDRFKRLRADEVRPEDIMVPENVVRYVRRHVYEASMSTRLPVITDLGDMSPKPVFVADNTVFTDAIVDPTTGTEYQLGETLNGGVNPTMNPD